MRRPCSGPWSWIAFKGVHSMRRAAVGWLVAAVTGSQEVRRTGELILIVEFVEHVQTSNCSASSTTYQIPPVLLISC